MDLKCSNIYNDLYTYQNGFTMYKDTQWCVHITMDVQCTNIHNGMYTYHNECTNIHKDVYTYHNGCTMYKHAQ
jgi:hypothetical protein